MRPWSRYRFTCEVGLCRRANTGLDEHGNEVVNYSPKETLPDAIFTPSATSEEETATRDHLTVAATLYLPPGTKISPFDQIITPDETVWDVDGEPQVWEKNPFTGTPGGVVVKLIRRQG